jgi:endonuclease/exonuclease/phosphatase (EEP) superfamily protein YafD
VAYLPWVLAAPWVVWAVVRAGGLEAGFPLVPALALTPVAAATSVVPVAVALLARRWGAAAAALAAAAVLAACVLPRALPGPSPAVAPEGPQLRVLTLNLLAGGADSDAVVDLVRRSDADVLAVQEATPAAVDALERAGLGADLPHAVVDAAPGVAGGALYARHPVQRVGAPVVPSGPVFALPRARIAVPGAPPVEAASVHPMPPLGGAAVSAWERAIDGLPPADSGGPLRILAGDLNATLDHAALRALLATGYTDAADAASAGLRPTWPGEPLPFAALDHVLVDARAAVDAVEVHDVPGTDHRAVLAELTLPAA